MTDNSMVCAGIDVSKTRLDVALHPGTARLSVAYDQAGLDELDAFLDGHAVSRVGFEASGGYDLPLLVHLRGKRRPAGRFQPMQVRAFARSRLLRAKNDRLDAALIAAYTASLDALPPLPQPRFDKLAAELTYIEQLEEQIACLKTMAETTHACALRRLHESDIARLQKRRTVRIALLVALIARDEELRRRFELLLSIKGVGERTALALVIRLPELGSASREEIAALAGLAPYDDDSGKRRGRRHVQGGRKRLRKSLFMSAFASTRFNPDLQSHYKRLRSAGKPHLLAIIATARKLVILANAIITRGTPWTPQLA